MRIFEREGYKMTETTKRLIEKEIEDQKEALDFLKKLSYMPEEFTVPSRIMFTLRRMLVMED